jgi:hypothetical protein
MFELPCNAYGRRRGWRIANTQCGATEPRLNVLHCGELRARRACHRAGLQGFHRYTRLSIHMINQFIGDARLQADRSAGRLTSPETGHAVDGHALFEERALKGSIPHERHLQEKGMTRFASRSSRDCARLVWGCPSDFAFHSGVSASLPAGVSAPQRKMPSGSEPGGTPSRRSK